MMKRKWKVKRSFETSILFWPCSLWQFRSIKTIKGYHNKMNGMEVSPHSSKTSSYASSVKGSCCLLQLHHFFYTTRAQDKSRRCFVPPHQNLILFPLPDTASPICVFNCNNNQWLPDIYPNLRHHRILFYPHGIKSFRKLSSMVCCFGISMDLFMDLISSIRNAFPPWSLFLFVNYTNLMVMMMGMVAIFHQCILFTQETTSCFFFFPGRM